MTTYAEFLSTKQSAAPPSGRIVPPAQLCPHLFDWQRRLVAWALARGRAALFADCGLGKALMALSWAEHAANRVLILAPLAVAHQIVREGEKFGIPATYARAMHQSPARGITVTNYEMLDHFDAGAFGAVVLDESSVLRHYETKTRNRLIETFRDTPMRLCCTATPAPNDISEMGNHAEFLSIMPRVEMLAQFFLHEDSRGWRLKGHAHRPFYRWLSTWAMSLTKPSDIGGSDAGYHLPPLDVRPHFVPCDTPPPGRLFAVGLDGLQGAAAARRASLKERLDTALRIVEDEPDEPWIIWCGLNDEANAMVAALPGSVNVEGSLPVREKERRILAFLDGEARVMVTKPDCAGLGLNMQHCARMLFLGLSYSMESYYQCLRRCWRYGQERCVIAHVVLSDQEACVYETVLRKEREADTLRRELIASVADFERQSLDGRAARDDYAPAVPFALPQWLANSSS